MEIAAIITAILDYIKKEGGEIKANFRKIASAVKENLLTVGDLIYAMIDDRHIDVVHRRDGPYIVIRQNRRRAAGSIPLAV